MAPEARLAGALAEFRHHGNTHVERFPGRNAAPMRIRIEADIDIAIGGKMRFAIRRSEQRDASGINSVGPEAVEQILACLDIIEHQILDDQPGSRIRRQEPGP